MNVQCECLWVKKASRCADLTPHRATNILLVSEQIKIDGRSSYRSDVGAPHTETDTIIYAKGIR